MDDGSSITTLLRQCTVLATRLGLEPLRTWAARELQGYPDDVELPPYRKRFMTQVLGDFSGPAGSGLRNAQVPPGNLPEELAFLKEKLYFAETRQGVAELERLANSGETSFQIPWPADVVVAVQSNYYEFMALQRAWQVVPATAIHSALSGIRDRVLQFALDIEQQNPDAGEAAPGEAPIAEPVVNQIFNQNFYGDNTSFAAGGRDVTQTVSAKRIDMTSLEASLTGLGVPKDERVAVITAIEEDESAGEPRPGPRTRRWLQRVNDRAVTIGAGVATSTIGAVVLHELGLK